MTRIRPAALVLAFGLVGLACTGGDDASSPAEANEPSAVPNVPGEASDLPGSLLVVDGTGSLVTMRPDGSQRTTLAVGDPEALRVYQAAWAPDGAHVAWSQLDAREGSAVARVITSGPAGEGRVETQVELPPFYLAWDPTSRHVAFLGNRANGDGIGLGVIRLATSPDAQAERLDTGQPYYFSWAPDGERMLVHVGDDRLEELSIEGTASTVDRRPGAFQAPVWTPDGTTHVYVRPESGQRQRIVLQERGDGTHALVAAEGAVFMVLSPDGSRLAYQSLSPDEFDIYDRELPTRATDVGVRVVDLATGNVQEVSTDVAHAWFWSPDGSRLAVLEPVYTASDQILFRWRIWDGDRSFVTDLVSPSLDLLQDYTPFFSQFAQSSTIWSPDGSAIAFPADGPSGPAVLIQPAREDATPYAVSTGSFVVWSPV
jgi:Tol biopolymer transport system component